MTALDDAPTIALLSPASFAHGQPHDQFEWLREHDPVHWHKEPNGGLASGRSLAIATCGRRSRCGHVLVEPGIMIPDTMAASTSATTR